MKRLWFLIALAGMLALAGCPKPAGDTAAVSVVQTDEIVATESESPAGAPAGGSDEDAPAADQASASSPGAGRPTPEQLEGKWFALYGGTGLGSKTYTFENGHTLEFMQGGVAIWKVTGDGGRGLQLVSNWDLSSGEIALTVEKADSLSGAFVEETPLAFGRDDEVGLTSAGDGAPPVVFRYTPQLAGQFLALEGRRGELMVYGRVENAAPDSAPDLSGLWKLKSPSGLAEAKAEAKGEQLQVSWGSPLRNTFNGAYTNGYFVGTVSSSAGSAFAALMPAAGGVLDGVITTEPYSKMETSFDLTRDS